MIKNKKRWSKNQLKNIPECNEDIKPALKEAKKMAERGKKRTDDEHKVEMFEEENLDQLAADVVNHQYHPSRGKAFVVKNPVLREIFAAPFRDRIIHHLLYALNGFWWNRHFIYDSYSCRDKKGTLLAVQRLQKFIEKASECGKRKVVVIKGDILGYFMSLYRDKLFEQVVWGLDHQFKDKDGNYKNAANKFLYELCRYLWAEIIFDNPVENVKMAGGKKEWKDLPKRKSLFFQIVGRGIVIGNLTSQLLSNIFLDMFDRYMKFELGFKYYGRYVDDFFIVVPEEDLDYALEAMRTAVPAYLDNMGLTLHPDKLYVQPAEHGVSFLGMHVHRTYMTLGKRVKKNLYKAAREVEEGNRNPEAITSYLGMGKHASAKKLFAKVFESVGWEYKF